MKTLYRLWTVTFLLAAHVGMAAEMPLAETKLPIPPQQNAPWIFPAKVPDPQGEIKTAIDQMFQLGIADPRGCVYHHLTVKEGGELHDARGWVLPASEGDPKRYAIGWNGLIYPVESIGQEADLAADVEILRKKGEFEEPPFDNYREETLEKILMEFAATPRMMRAWAAPYLLLRLGVDIKIDEGADDKNDDPFAEKTPVREHLVNTTEFYLDEDHWQLVSLARLMRGDGVACVIDKNDWLAAMRLQAYDRVWAEVVKRMPEENQSPHASFNARPKLHSSWRSLLADSQRRLSPDKRIADSDIAREIASWDELESWDSESPPATFAKVVAAGSTAIAPLLDCLEHDLRWTRIRENDGRIHGDGTEYLHFVRVKDLALRALNENLRFEVIETSVWSLPAEDSWYVDATARMKKICQKYGNARSGELWYRILADENADIDDQCQAAGRIVRRDYEFQNTLFGGPHLLYNSRALADFVDSTPSVEGAKLLNRQDPSVMNLLERAWRKSRILTDQAIAKGAQRENFPCFPGAQFSTIFDQSHELVLLTVAWQQGNTAVLKEHYDWLTAELAEMRKAEQFHGFLVSRLSQETLVMRLWAEDQTAMRDFETLFRSNLLSSEIPMEVMQIYPQEPGMDALAKEAFLGDKAPLSLIHQPWKQDDSRESFIRCSYSDGSASSLLVLPSFRRALIEALKNKTKQGTLLVTKDGCSILYDASAAKSNPPDESVLPGTGQEVRLCDIVADLLTPKSGPNVWTSPRFLLQGKVEERDRVIADWIKILSVDTP